MNLVQVKIWNFDVGTLLVEGDRSIFQYEPDFVSRGLELSPLMMPLTKTPRSFRVPDHFRTLPGLLADSLPDRFGNALIDAWIASRGISRADFTPADRLSYVGSRGMGALEFKPANHPGSGRRDHAIDLGTMVELAGLALNQREAFVTDIQGSKEQAVKDILSIGTSAGGARAKAVIAFNEKTGQIRSGQIDAGPDFEQYLLKLDGVSESSRESLGEGQGFGRIEYAYHLMALEAGVEMTPSRLLEEGGRAHFMTRRFDRSAEGKLHIQTLSALEHLDFNLSYHWEGAFTAARSLNLSPGDLEQMFLRAMFNAAFRNQDDHVKNMSFIMDRDGTWSLAPAYDLIYAHNPEGRFTRTHQMSVNGERDGPDFDDFREMAKTVSLDRGIATRSLERIRAAAAKWPQFAEEAGIDESITRRIEAEFRSLRAGN
ncbi:MAG: type II toxin-antitoxin system HipA family toxin [Solirubrobacterales bacterium]|nr:type II toxin-antitoxin system HipA family toxin [Solirubrobacterales bacterium]